jgi:hypothetical protein
MKPLAVKGILLLFFVITIVWLLPTVGRETTPSCPDLLIQQNSVLALVWSHQPLSKTNPLYFPHMTAYLYYMEKRRAATPTSVCPILQIQQEQDVDPDGKYRVHDPANPRPTVAFRDSSTGNPSFNQNMYQGFDPLGLHVGQYTKLDVIHDSTNTTWVPY